MRSRGHTHIDLRTARSDLNCTNLFWPSMLQFRPSGFHQSKKVNISFTQSAYLFKTCPLQGWKHPSYSSPRGYGSTILKAWVRSFLTVAILFRWTSQRSHVWIRGICWGGAGSRHWVPDCTRLLQTTSNRDWDHNSWGNRFCFVFFNQWSCPLLANIKTERCFCVNFTCYMHTFDTVCPCTVMSYKTEPVFFCAMKTSDLHQLTFFFRPRSIVHFYYTVNGLIWPSAVSLSYETNTDERY